MWNIPFLGCVWFNFLKLSLLKKWEFQKVQYETKFFLKSWVFSKNCQKVLFENAKCLANTYKSGGLSYKLPKMTMYI